MSLDLGNSAAWETSTLGMLHRQLLEGQKPLARDTCLDGQTAVITGSNCGLGFEAARQLLQLGLSRLILGVRSESKGAAAASKLQDQYPHAIILVFIVDLTDYDSIMNFSYKCEQLDRLDYVILNAGLMASSLSHVESTSHELVFQTNYLSTVLMALVLLPILIAKRQDKGHTKPSTLSIVGSDTMYLSTFRSSSSIIATMDNPESWDDMHQYSTSKLLLMMFVSRLARKLSPEDVIVNVCNPGLTTGTAFTDNNHGRGWLSRASIKLLMNCIARRVEVGASIYIHALLGVDNQSHGSFFSDWVIKPYASIMYTPEGEKIGDALWKETLEELSFAKGSSIKEIFD